jgi:hypothetical protein
MGLMDKFNKDPSTWSGAPKPAEAPKTEAAPAEKPAAAAPASPASGSPGSGSIDVSYLPWLAKGVQGYHDALRSLNRATTLGGLDWATGAIQGMGGDPRAAIAAQRAETDAARERIGPYGRAATDVAGWLMGPGKFIPGGPVMQGTLGGAAQGYFTGQGGPGGGGGAADIALGASLGAGAGAVAKGVSAAAGPVAQWTRGKLAPDPASVVYPYLGRSDVAGPTLGGVPGVYPGSKLGNMSAADVASMARDMERAAQGEEGGVTSPGMQALVQRINNLAAQGTPQGGAPGSGLPAVVRSYWAQGGPPAAMGGEAGGMGSEVAKMAGATTGGLLGRATGVPGAGEIGTYLGSTLAPRAVRFATPKAGETAYSAFAGGPPGLPPGANDALRALILGGRQDWQP